MKNKLTYLTLAGYLALASTSSAVVIFEGHNDLGLLYDSGTLDMEIHAEDLNSEFAPEEVTFYVGENAVTTNGANFDFFGVGNGQPYWRLYDEEVPGNLLIGIGAEEVGANEPDLLSYVQSDERWNTQDAARWLKIQLKGFTGPGEFAVWGSGDNGPVVYWQTSNGVGSQDYALAVAGSHGDFNWGFSQAGMYELTLEGSATLADGSIISTGDHIISIDVQSVPEPGTVAALALGIIALARRKR